LYWMSSIPCVPHVRHVKIFPCGWLDPQIKQFAPVM
jgi:hypothetical protein